MPRDGRERDGGRGPIGRELVMALQMVIESLGVYLPQDFVTTAEVVAPCAGVPLDFFERFTGIRKVPAVGRDEFSIDLARKAVTECLATSRFSPGEFDLLICCNISRCDGPDGMFSLEPATALRLKKEFGFANALAFDLSNACAGVFTGLLLADLFLKTGGARRALVVSGEHTRFLVPGAQQEIDGLLDPRLACLTLGDSGLALSVELSGTPGVGFQEIDLFTVGKFSHLCRAMLTDREHGGAIMHTESSALVKAASDHFVPHALLTLQRCGWDPEAVDHFIMHQTAQMALDLARFTFNQYRGKPWLHEGNFVSNLENRGNLATNTHFVALWDRALAGQVRAGERTVFSIEASGLTIGTALYTLDDLPDRLRERRPPAVVETRDIPSPAGDPVVDRACRVRVESVGISPEKPGPRRGMIELARSAGEACLERSRYAREDVDLVIYTGVYRDGLLSEPAVASILAGELRVNHDPAPPYPRKTLAFDVVSGSVGFLKACFVASQLIRSGRYRNALVLTAENEELPFPVSGGGHRPIAPVGAAVLLDRAGDMTDGFGQFWFPFYPKHQDRRAVCSGKRNGKPVLLVRQDPELEAVALRCLADCVRRDVLPEVACHPGKLFLLPSRLGRGAVRRLALELDLPEDRIITPPDGEQDLFTATFAYSWIALHRSGHARPGNVGLFIQVGAGLEVGCASYLF